MPPPPFQILADRYAPFLRDVAKLTRKDPSLPALLQQEFSRLETQGVYKHESIGDQLYKRRVRSALRGRGKRGGYRLILYRQDPSLIPVAIYHKSDKQDLTLEERTAILRELG
ncbi:MAG: type II toxin-antitoxin system RelE/ParE family toxin [candidate division NC10 bacterium]|nr:type II toxin-antitoxin system RelE/ParE family toxin [candidate division NC10 bacterium]